MTNMSRPAKVLWAIVKDTCNNASVRWEAEMQRYRRIPCLENLMDDSELGFKKRQFAEVVMAYVVMAHAVMAYAVMAYVVIAYAVMAYVAIVYVVMAYVLWPM